MMEVIDRLWEQVEPTVFISKDEWLAGMADWDIKPVEIDGKLAFALLTNGHEFHFASFDTGAPITKRMSREWLEPTLEKYGFVTTRTPKEGADRQHRFNRVFGFRAIGEDEYFVEYKKCR